MQKFGRRGAALAEYGFLLGLISIISIGSVASLGSEVSENFRDIAHELSTLHETEDCAISAPDGPVSEWEMSFNQNDETSASPDCALPVEGGSWIVNVKDVVSQFPEGERLYYDAWIYQSGVRTVGDLGQCAYNLRPMSFFRRSEGRDQGILGGLASSEDGYSDCTPHTSQRFTLERSVTGATVPSYVTSIDLWTERQCSIRATCIDGPLKFSIRFYTR